MTVVLVTGVPGSGKTTLAKQLGAELSLPVLSLDTVKESLFDSLGVRDRSRALQLRAASLQVVWSLLPHCYSGAVVDAWLHPTHDAGAAQRGFAGADVGPVYEVLCTVPGPVAAARYAARPRHSGHLPPDDQPMLDRIVEAAELLRPQGLGPSLRVDTSTPVDVANVVAWLADVRGDSGSAPAFRRFVATDSDGVLRLHEEALRATDAYISVDGYYADMDDIEGHYLATGGEFLVVEVHGDIAAIGGVQRLDHGVAEIRRIRVAPLLQGRGIGKELLRRLEAAAAERGCTHVRLDTTVNQVSAQQLFRAAGYVEVRRGSKGGPLETIFYEKRLGD